MEQLVFKAMFENYTTEIVGNQVSIQTLEQEILSHCARRQPSIISRLSFLACVDSVKDHLWVFVYADYAARIH